MEKLPLISVIVPVYKVEQYLRRCVDSILAQTYTNIEVILIDDGSPDGCPAICDEYAEKDSRVVVIHQKNAGVSAARNAGLDVAKGDYIGFVDSDDWIEPDMYEVLLNLIINNNADISVITYIDETEECTLKVTKSDTVEVINRNDAIREMLIGKKFLGGMTDKLFSKKLKDNMVFPVGITIAEDLAVCVNVFANADRVVYQDYTCYHYFQRRESAMHKFNVNSLTVCDAYDIIFSVVKKHSPENLYLVKLKSIKWNLSSVILAIDNNWFDNELYKKTAKRIDYSLDKKTYSLLNSSYKTWLALFKLGRVPFIIGRKMYRKLSEGRHE